MTYRSTSTKFAAGLAVFALWTNLSLSQVKPPMQSGRLIAAQLIGHGKNPDPGANLKRSQGDIWWSYCVASDGKAYDAVSRISPTKSGLTVNRAVQFSVERKSLIILGAKGERLTMRIVRQGDESICH